MDKFTILFIGIYALIGPVPSFSQAISQPGSDRSSGEDWMTQPWHEDSVFVAARERVTADFLSSKYPAEVLSKYVSAARSSKGDALAAFCGATVAMLAMGRAATYDERNNYFQEGLQCLSLSPSPNNYECARLRFLFDAGANARDPDLPAVANRLLSKFGSDPPVLGASGACFFDPQGPDKGNRGIELVEREIRLDPARPDGYATLGKLYTSMAECYDSPHFARLGIAAYSHYLSIWRVNGDIRADAARTEYGLQMSLAGKVIK